MQSKLTPAFVKAAVAEHGKHRTVFWDVTLPGFGLMVTRSGARSYVVQYRTNGRSRRLTLDTGRLSLKQARREARKHLGEAEKGGDPLGERRKLEAAAEAAKAGTLETLAQEYFRREGRKIR